MHTNSKEPQSARGEAPSSLPWQQEWKDSGVDPALTALNTEGLSGSDLFNYLYPKPDRRNGGRLTDSYMRKWENCQESGGWLVRGVNFLTGERSSYQRFKQTSGKPIVYDPKKQKAAKYLTPKGTAVQPIFLGVPDSIWDKCCERYKQPRGEARHFWEWVKLYLVPIVITEGEKKAGCLLSQGIVAISLPGILTGYRLQVCERELIPQFQYFDDGRKITIVFDYREGNYFNSPEFKAAKNLAGLFKNAKVKIARLPGPQKGVDDFIVAGGDYEKVLEGARPLSGWQDERLWLMYKEFTPTHTTNQRYFDWNAPESGKITAIKSGLGTGKTQYVTDNVASGRGKQINIGYRNSLLLQQAEKWGSYHIDAHSGYQMVQDPDARISLCWDSLGKIPVETFEGSTLILDEASSSIKHLLTSSTCSGSRLSILQHLKWVAPLVDRIIALDGNLADWVVDYLSEVSGKPAVKIENQFKGDTPPVYFLEPKKGRISKAEWEAFSLAVRKSRLPAIATDSRIEAEALAKLLEDDGKTGVLITSKTVAEEEVKRFLANPDSHIRSGKPEFLIFTPTAESGVDISIPHYFSDMFVAIFGVLGADEAMQISRRVRHPERIIILCAEKGLPGKDGDATYHKQLIEAITEQATFEAVALSDKELIDVTKEAIAAQASSPDFLAWCKIQAKKNLERKNLKNFLLKNFEAAGFDIQHYPLSAVKSSQDHSDAKAFCRDEEAQQIFDAEDIDIQDALDIHHNFCATWADRCKSIKARLKARLPGIERTSLWSWKFIRRIRFEERELLSQLETAWLFNNPDDADDIQRDELRDWGVTETFLPDLGNRWLKLKLLSRLGIEKFLDPSRVWTNESPELLELLKTCRKKSAASLLGHPGKLSPIRYLNQLLKLIGAKLIGKQIREGDTRKWVYQFTSESRPADWDELYSLTSKRMAEKIASVKMAETPMLSDVECVTDTSVNISPTAPSVTDSPIDTPPQTEVMWGWMRKGLERIRVHWHDKLSQYKVLVDGGTSWLEMDAAPLDIQWEA